MSLSSTTLSSGASTNSNSITANFTVSETVTGFTASDVTVQNGTLGALSTSGNVYSGTLTASAEGLVRFVVNSNRFTDAAGNSNSASATVFGWTYDATAPTVTIASSTVSNGDTSNDASIALSFTLSEASTDFASGDITVSNRAISGFSGSGTSYTATFTPARMAQPLSPLGQTALMMLHQTAILPLQPLAGTMMAPHRRSIASSTVSSGDTSNDASIALSFTLSEASTDFAAGDITVSNGAISGFSGLVPATPTFTLQLMARPLSPLGQL